MTERSTKIKESMAAAGNWRGREACVALLKNCSVEAPCRMCRQKGRERQEQMMSALCLFDEDASEDPVWDEVALVDVEAEARPKAMSWMSRMSRLMNGRTKKTGLSEKEGK